MWWFIPLDDSSKENRPEEQEEPAGEVEAAQPGKPNTVWYDTAAKTAREPLRPRQQFDDDDDDDVVAHPGPSASCHQIMSLQVQVHMFISTKTNKQTFPFFVLENSFCKVKRTKGRSFGLSEMLKVCNTCCVCGAPYRKLSPRDAPTSSRTRVNAFES